MVRQTSLLPSPPKRQIYKPAQITDEESLPRRDKHFTLGYVNFRCAGTSGLQGEKFRFVGTDDRRKNGKYLRVGKSIGYLTSSNVALNSFSFPPMAAMLALSNDTKDVWEEKTNIFQFIVICETEYIIY